MQDPERTGAPHRTRRFVPFPAISDGPLPRKIARLPLDAKGATLPPLRPPSPSDAFCIDFLELLGAGNAQRLLDRTGCGQRFVERRANASHVPHLASLARFRL